MKSPLRHAEIFVGCYFGCAAAGTVLITAVANHFAQVSVDTIALMSKLSVLAAVIPASLIAGYLNRVYAKRAARRLLEKEWLRWMSQRRAQESPDTRELELAISKRPDCESRAPRRAKFKTLRAEAKMAQFPLTPPLEAGTKLWGCQRGRACLCQIQIGSGVQTPLAKSNCLFDRT